MVFRPGPGTWWLRSDLASSLALTPTQTKQIQLTLPPPPKKEWRLFCFFAARGNIGALGH